MLLSQVFVILMTTLASGFSIAHSIHHNFRNSKFKTIPSTPITGPVTADFVSTISGLDAPKLSGINGTSFDWWYFDVVSPDLNTSLVVVFYTATPVGFYFLDSLSAVTSVGFYATFANGTRFNTYLEASEARISAVGDGSYGAFVGTGAQWKGSSDMRHWKVTINALDKGIVGSFALESRAPAHYTCGVGAGKDMRVTSTIGWSNAVPDAVGTVDFKLGGSPLKFTGLGYHDKNWSPQAFDKSVASWYWGHGRLGEYSIVWFDALQNDGTEIVSAYVSQNGKILTSSCETGSALVRPIGINNEYPPTTASGDPGGFFVILRLDKSHVLTVNVTTTTTLLGGGSYSTRWAGSMVGRVNGGPLMKGGVALFEEFDLVDPVVSKRTV